jgi:hypothetical protein
MSLVHLVEYHMHAFIHTQAVRMELGIIADVTVYHDDCIGVKYQNLKQRCRVMHNTGKSIFHNRLGSTRGRELTCFHREKLSQLLLK